MAFSDQLALENMEDSIQGIHSNQSDYVIQTLSNPSNFFGVTLNTPNDQAISTYPDSDSSPDIWELPSGRSVAEVIRGLESLPDAQ